MWLPHRLYEALPGLCLAFGAVLIAGSLYVGFDSLLAWLCLAAATISFGYAAAILVLRRRYRRPRAKAPVAVDETGEVLQAMARRFH